LKGRPSAALVADYHFASGIAGITVASIQKSLGISAAGNGE